MVLMDMCQGKTLLFQMARVALKELGLRRVRENNIFRHIIMMVHRQKRTQVITLGNKINIMFISIFAWTERGRECGSIPTASE